MTAPANLPEIKFHLDAPSDWDACPRILAARGWVFAADSPAAVDIQAWVGGTKIAATTGHYRPDVPAAFPEAPNSCCGFQIAARTPTGTFDFEIQVRVAGKPWQTVFAQKAHAPRWRQPFALGGGTPEELLQGQLSLVPQHAARPIVPDRLRPHSFDPLGSEITVVTPSYNQATWLPQNLASVNPLRSDRVSHLVIDGDSSDGSAALLEKHAEQLAYWVSEPDTGQADAIAKGFAHPAGAGSEIMAWLNADDHYLPGTLPCVQHYFDTHPEVDVLYGNRVIVDETGAQVGSWVLPPHDPEVLRIYDFVPQETLFWRRSIWEQVGGIDRSFQFAMDWDLLLRFAAAGARIVHMPRRLGAFRVHARQKSAAAMGNTGQLEIDALRTRTFGREVSTAEIISSGPLEHYLRRSARETWWDRWGIRRRVR
jgi:hypothetical protein